MRKVVDVRGGSVAEDLARKKVKHSMIMNEDKHGACKMIRTGYVRVKTDHSEVSVQAMTLGPGGQWSLFQPHGNVFVYRFDDENPEIDTLICVVNRLEAEESEIQIETVWHENGVPLIRYEFEAYYTEVKFISARECVMGTVPIEEEDDE